MYLCVYSLKVSVFRSHSLRTSLLLHILRTSLLLHPPRPPPVVVERTVWSRGAPLLKLTQVSFLFVYFSWLLLRIGLILMKCLLSPPCMYTYISVLIPFGYNWLSFLSLGRNFCLFQEAWNKLLDFRLYLVVLPVSRKEFLSVSTRKRGF